MYLSLDLRIAFKGPLYRGKITCKQGQLLATLSHSEFFLLNSKIMNLITFQVNLLEVYIYHGLSDSD